MKIAYFDCFAGISGDMTIGAMLDLGVDLRALEAELKKLNVPGYQLQQSKVMRSGISATKFDVEIHSAKEAASKTPAGLHHSHDHEHRPLSAIVELIDRSGITESAKTLSRKIFERLGAAEAKVHQVPIEEVHFHEVGAVDSIIDIVGSAIGLDWLNFEKVICSPINLGSGSVECDHGKYPVPGPATAELLKGIPVYSDGPTCELTTPTGAAIISTIASEFGRLRSFEIEKIGYGAGSRSFDEFPNTLRLLVGKESAESGIGEGANLEKVTVIEANIDDMSPQIYGYFVEKALAAGALEVFITAVQMKKNRPGQLLTVLCDASHLEVLTHLVFRETTTIGLRVREEQRRTLNRSVESVETSFGRVRVKVARLNGSVLNIMPEFEDCRRLAEQHEVPLKDVLADAHAKIQSLKL
ncbi:MAG: nickel pincer cofactor biosynthesis protein LarC [Acidobacteriia bacterium]|nr:nickel pincer cofactor biosynthesis protein LarC [Terriglobia bacterium]